MERYEIFDGPDRLSFMGSLTAEIDGVPAPGYISRPQGRGGNVAPSYKGEPFKVKLEDNQEQIFHLIICQSGRIDHGSNGTRQRFEALLWTDAVHSPLFAIDPTNPWVLLRGEYDFSTRRGWVELNGAP